MAFSGTREEIIWAEKRRYIGVRVIAERVILIAGSDCRTKSKM